MQTRIPIVTSPSLESVLRRSRCAARARGYPSSDCRQRRQTFDVRFVCAPRDAAQEQYAKQRVVERPVVVAEDVYEDAAFALAVRLERPHQRLRLSVLGAARQDMDFARVADELPVGLVQELDALEAARDRVFAVGERQV